MHKQAGYSCNGFRASLYNTTVVEKMRTLVGPNEFGLRLRTGGWVTQSTAKAINGTLKDWGLADRFRVNRKQGAMYLTCVDRGTIEFEDITVPL